MSGKKVRELLRAHSEGRLSSDAVVENLGRMYPQEDRVSFVRARYTTDPMMTNVINMRTNKTVDRLVHAGPDQSPVTSERAIWFILKGDDPHKVGREPGGRLYAQYAPGGDHVYI